MAKNNPPSQTPEAEPQVTVVSSEPEYRRYLIAPRRSMAARLAGIQPMSASGMNGVISTLGIDVVRRIQRDEGVFGALSAQGEATEIVVAKLEPMRADLLRMSVPPSMVITEDARVDYEAAAFGRVPAVHPTGRPMARKIKFQVVDPNGKPIPGLEVQLTGDGFPSHGVTNDKGEVELDLVTLGDRPPRLLWVKANHTFWDLYLTTPRVSDTALNRVQMRPFSETIEGFPEKFRYGWGQRLMGLHEAPKEINGAGVKIAIIDSGCDNTHPLLSHVKHGQDYSDDDPTTNWNQDLIGHGTHCAGIITARSEEDTMLRGFAPEAEIHILRVFPGGRYSNLVEALQYCIANQIDVVNMSLGGGPDVNEVVQEMLEAAANAGIVLIAAAGNSGDAVKFPASSPHVMAVGAIGSLNDMPNSIWEWSTVQDGLKTTEGLFSPQFSCYGPKISVCAPGVAIVSTVPGGFKSDSGTSMAAPHVTGLAALLLAHHPVFHTTFRERSIHRVEALFDLIRRICKPLPFGYRSGLGMPYLGAILRELTGSAAEGTVPLPQSAAPAMAHLLQHQPVLQPQPLLQVASAYGMLSPQSVLPPYYRIR